MNIKRTIAAITIGMAGLGVGAGSVAAGQYASPEEPPPPPPPTTMDELVSPERRAESTTCEGAVQCKLLDSICGAVGGTYTDWTSRDHGHTHGICTWPWE